MAASRKEQGWLAKGRLTFYTFYAHAIITYYFFVLFFTQYFFENVIKIFLIPFTDWVFQFKYQFALSNYFTLKISPITWKTQHLSCFICPHHHLHIFIKRSLYGSENYVAQPLIPKTLHVHSPVSQPPASFSVTLLMFLEPLVTPCWPDAFSSLHTVLLGITALV